MVVYQKSLCEDYRHQQSGRWSNWHLGENSQVTFKLDNSGNICKDSNKLRELERGGILQIVIGLALRNLKDNTICRYIGGEVTKSVQ